MSELFSGARKYFGMDLPKRSVRLKFTLPEISGRFKARIVSDSEIKRELNELKENPAEYFSMLASEIKQVNRCALKSSQRLALVREVLALFYPLALAQLAQHAKTDGVPEADDRKQTLNLMASIAQTLTGSCQILFAEWYEGDNFQYARSHDALLECASNIFELLALRQRIRALRYQILNEQDWRLANTLFYVLSQYEDVGQELPTLRKRLGLDNGHGMSTFHELFASLHIMARFDPLGWPAHLQWVTGNYLRGVENPVQVRMNEEGGTLERCELIAYGYGGGAAVDHNNTTAQGPGMILNYRGLADAIRKDCMGLMQSRKSRNGSGSPVRFERFSDAERYVICERLLDGLQVSKPALREQRTSINDFRIFVGFVEVFNLLRHQQGEYAREERLADALSKRSALLAEDNQVTDQSLWSILYQDKSMVRLSTQETQFTTPMHIGALLAYGVGEDICRPRLAVITRLYRPSEGVLVVDLLRVASYAEAVMMTVNASEQTMLGKTRTFPALLVHDKRTPGRWDFMFQPMDVLPGLDEIMMYRGGQIMRVNLGNLCIATTDFRQYITPLDSTLLGVEGEPSYRMPDGQQAKTGGYFPGF